MDEAKMEKSSKPRSSKACDRCRLKKVKCDGSYPCARCTKDDIACVFGSRAKGREATVSANHVEQLTAQTEILKLALKTIWSKYVKPTLPAGTADPSIHEMCRQVGVLENPDLRQFHHSSDELSQHAPGETSPTTDEPGDMSEEEDLPDVPPLTFENSGDALVLNDSSDSTMQGTSWGYDPQNIDMMPMPSFALDGNNPYLPSHARGGPYLHGPTLLSQREPLPMSALGRQQQVDASNFDQKHYFTHGASFDEPR